LRAFSRVDVLFNNAAMAYFNWLEDISEEEWDRNRREEVDLVFYLTMRKCLFTGHHFLLLSHGAYLAFPE
jgi:NAD(P)-dependent dehydrogenase (short-subunit alcohol dehydrogenase family)